MGSQVALLNHEERLAGSEHVRVEDSPTPVERVTPLSHPVSVGILKRAAGNTLETLESIALVIPVSTGWQGAFDGTLFHTGAVDADAVSLPPKACDAHEVLFPKNDFDRACYFSAGHWRSKCWSILSVLADLCLVVAR